MQWNIENIVMIIIEHFVIKQNLALNNSQGLNMLLNNKLNQTKSENCSFDLLFLILHNHFKLVNISKS